MDQLKHIQHASMSTNWVLLFGTDQGKKTIILIENIEQIQVLVYTGLKHYNNLDSWMWVKI